MRNNQRRTGAPSRRKASPVAPAPATTSNLVYQVPTEFVELPSRGVFYAEDHPLHNQETVEIKYMTAKEEDILASAALAKKGLVLDRLLENILVLDVDPRSLLLGDRSAIMIAARISGYGNVYETEVKCPFCEAKNNLFFDLSKMTIVDRCFDTQFMSDNSAEIDQETNLLVVKLPVTEMKVGLRLIDGHSEQEATDISTNQDSTITTFLSTLIEKVEDTFDRPQIEEFIDNMPAKDSKYIRDIYSNLVPNVQLKENFSCTRCFQKKEMEVPLSADFFWPK